MKVAKGPIWGLGIAAALVAGSASAASWQDQLSSAASQLSQQNNSTSTTSSTQNGGLSLSSLTGLLNGGDKAVSANSMTNAAGVMSYCVQHNVVDNNVASVKDQVLSKLGLSSTTAQEQKTDYQQGLQGLLNTGNGQQLNLQSLSNSPMGEKVKTKACDVVLKQGKKYIGM
ncbi:endopeptidase [Pantoea rodasii]|uniref:Endopeptidase n=1 Tax=Pantoea rodasii TaxID=1076549 RepID=A0A0B1RE77_9GAMM|nr:endopeptidase [Pantoea rodasii]